MTTQRSNVRDVVDACRILANAGLAELYTGHVSRRSDSGVLIPAHRHADGLGLESMTEDAVIEVALDGEPADPEVEPPSEFVIHAGILTARSDVTSVVHSHPLYATGLSVSGTRLEPLTLDAAFFGGPVSVHDPGPRLIHDPRDGAALAEQLGEGEAILIRGHGAVTVGTSVAAATTRMYLLERAARLQYIAAQFGGLDSPYEPFGDDALKGSGEGFLEEAFEFLRRQYAGDGSPPPIGVR